MGEAWVHKIGAENILLGMDGIVGGLGWGTGDDGWMIRDVALEMNEIYAFRPVAM